MQHDYTFLKNKIVDFLTQGSMVGFKKGKIFASISLYVSFPFICYATWPYSKNVYFALLPSCKST